MFQKPTFGSTTTSTFGSFNAGTSGASPFGGFKPATGNTTFGAPPAFGAAASTQPATGGLFGASNTSGGLFGNTAASTSTPAFGSTAGGFGFGASPSTSGGLFGNNTGSSLFGNTQTSAFGAKPAGFGFGSTATPGTSTGGLFGAAPSTGTGLFRQPNTTMTSGGLFSNTTGGTFGGGAVVTGTAHAKYSPVLGTDVVVKSGTSQNINIKHHCITCMKEYENKSLEELRLEDYTAGRKGAQNNGMFGAGFAATTENKPLFGGTTFGQPATTTTTSVFGTGALGTNTGFGQTNSFSFGNNAQTNTNTTGLFGSAKPAFAAPATSGTLFGAATTQTPTFGTNTPSFGFGSNTQNQSTGIFGAKPATSGFGATPSSGFGSFGTSNLFQAKPQQPPAFPTQQPAFGSLSGGFGTNTSTSGGLFNSSFGKPATSAPAFGFNTQPTLGAGLGTGLGANTQAKPTVGGFGTLGNTSLFQQPQQNNMLSQGGLGNMFGGNSTLGAPSLGMGLNANNTSINSIGLTGSSAGGNVHEQILTLAARPYGESPLFKDLLPESSCTAEEALRPTNPAAVKALVDGARAPPPRHALRLQPRPLPADKKSLFDGLEESDASLEDKLSLKPSRKRLVLRSPKPAEPASENRSLEESSQPVNGSLDKPDSAQAPSDGQNRTSLTENNVEVPTEKNNSWLTSSKLPWNDKEKAIDNDATPRIYPNLDKELPIQPSERRASWLTTKPLRKPLGPSPDSAENSVRELGVRTPDRNSVDKENIDSLSVSEEEHVSPREMAPHPTGVKLTRPGYYTIPSLDEMIPYMRADGSCVVPHLTVGRHNYGNVYYDDDVDVGGLDLDCLVHFLNKEVIVYPSEADKPPLGSGLNRRAVVTLDRVWPRDKTRRQPITDPDRLIKMDYESKLRRVCDKHDTKFIEYRPQTGSWVFRVEHFSKYGLTDSDEEDDAIAPDVLKRQLANQALQKAAPVTSPKPQPPVGLGGLGLGAPEDSLFAMQQTSLNLLNGAGKAFEMDTTEDNGEAQSLYQDNRVLGVKSPTSELARLENRQSHHVQLMKASLYADADMEDDISVSTGDQLVPISSPLGVTTSVTSRRPEIELDHVVDQSAAAEAPSEQKLSPLLVQPHTIILQYHRRVPPFAQTIPGRLQASCLADMSICRARHSRVGFGPRATLAYVTTQACLANLPTNGELCDLGRYVAGRSENDWSESVVARLAIANGDSTCYLQEFLSRHMETLLECSSLVEAQSGGCGQLAVGDRRSLLKGYLLNNCGRDRQGVNSYCKQVWRLCDALWGADLDNDGVAGTDESSIVDRHRRLLSWLTEAVAETTDRELATDTAGEDEDENDGHSRRIWSLLVGGRVVEACKVARDQKDLNMALLIAQAAGDPSFRNLVRRQLSLWRECGAAPLIASHRFEALRLIAGEAKPLGKLLELDWLRAFHATARYLCPQVPTVERVVQTYEDLFPRADDGEQPSFVDSEELAMKPPLPPYMDTYDVIQSDKKHDVLDLRYELIRARATNDRPRLTPASHTTDPLDHSLCFLVGTWFGCPAVGSITGMADQLEAAGLWHLAVAALLYHPHEAQRSALVQGVISRHAPAVADTPDLRNRLELLKKLKVPDRLLRLAQAHRAKYQRLPAIEAEHLIAAEQWNAAHKVLMEELLPEAVLSDDLKSVAPILESLNEAASRHEVSGWQTGGLALYHYLHLCEQVRGLVSPEGGALAALRPRAAAACRALQHLKPISSRHAAARTEMGGRLVQLCIAGGVPASQLAAMLRALSLPPGTAAPALAQITTELAEQASDSCVESTTSSPRSSHHRMAVRS